MNEQQIRRRIFGLIMAHLLGKQTTTRRTRLAKYLSSDMLKLIHYLATLLDPVYAAGLPLPPVFGDERARFCELVSAAKFSEACEAVPASKAIHEVIELGAGIPRMMIVGWNHAHLFGVLAVSYAELAIVCAINNNDTSRAALCFVDAVVWDVLSHSRADDDTQPAVMTELDRIAAGIYLAISAQNEI